MQLTNGLIALDFDPDTGSLIHIQDLLTGREFLSDPSEGRLFRLFAPDDEEWIDRCIESHSAGRPEMTLQSDRLTIHFPEMRTIAGEPTAIAATVTVSLPAGEDEALFSLELHNHSPFMVHEVLFPWVGGWRGFGGENTSASQRGQVLCGDRWAFNPFTQLRNNAGWNLFDINRKHQMGFPHVNIPLCDITNDHVGLSINFYPRTPDLNFDFFILDLNEMIGVPHPSFGWVHRPFLSFGQSWTSGPVGISPHVGGWQHAARKMRRWLETWWRAPALPECLRGTIGFQNVLFRDFMGRHWRPLSDMPVLAKHGLQHGLSHFLVWDMPLLGMYVRAGSGGLFDDSAGRLAELRQALEQVRKMGVYASPLINLRLGMQRHPFWHEHGEAWAIRSYYGHPAQETLPLRTHTSALINTFLDQGGTRFCQSNPEFQEWALQQVGKVLDLGFNALFLDQPFSENYCFSPTHGHPTPAYGHVGAIDWTNRAAQLVQQRNPGSYVIGEVPDIWNTQFLHLWWFWDWSWLRPEVFRYVLPESLQSWVIDACDHQDQVSQAFTQGFLLNLNVHSLEKTLLDAPELADRVAQLAALRRKTQHCTVDGRFLHHDGIALDTDAAVTAAVYRNGPHLGVALGEGARGEYGGGKAGGGSLKLSLQPELLEEREVKEILLHRQDGTTETLMPRQVGDELEVETRLAHWECAVVEVN